MSAAGRIIWLHVTVPIGSFAIPQAREFVESYPFPPPATIYGMLLSLIGETDRSKYRGVRVGIVLRSLPMPTVVLRKIRRVKVKDLTHPNNSKPDYQTILTGIDFLVRLRDAMTDDSLVERVEVSLTKPEKVKRFGGLSCGESHNLVDQIRLVTEQEANDYVRSAEWVVMPSEDGDWTCPVWVDHVGSEGTVWEQAMLMPIEASFSIEQLRDFAIVSHTS